MGQMLRSQRQWNRADASWSVDELRLIRSPFEHPGVSVRGRHFTTIPFFVCFLFFFFAPQLPNAPKRKRGDTVWEVEEDASWQKTGNPTGAKAGTSFSFRLE